jgi:ubiquinone/menaquinone biosynthesis C-methylase UbiE
MNQIQNPWLQIPISDYVGHMSDKGVRQYKMLNSAFKRAYQIKKPHRLLVLGVTDGNGLEYVSEKITNKIIALDINPEYIKTAQRRFQKIIPQCDFLCEDVTNYKFPLDYFDMVHAALLFEYVDYQNILINIAGSLKFGGVLSTVIQIKDKNISKISKTPYKSLQNLVSIMKIVDINEFLECTASNSLLEIRHEILKPCGEKSFYFGIFEKIYYGEH